MGTFVEGLDQSEATAKATAKATPVRHSNLIIFFCLRAAHCDPGLARH